MPRGRSVNESMLRDIDRARAKRRRNRSRSHSRTGRVVRRRMNSSEAVNPDPNKKRRHEAQMIPGIDGIRRFGFPNTILTKLRYWHYVTISGAAGARALNVFAANGIFDPDISGVGHQPLYRDQYAAIYDQYVVIGSKITAHFLNSTAVNYVCGIVGDDDSSVTTVVETLGEQNNSVWGSGGPLTGMPKTVLTMDFEPLRDFGVAAEDDGSSQTATGTNPTELWVYGVWAAAADASSGITINLAVEIEYTVKFAELLTPTQS